MQLVKRLLIGALTASLGLVSFGAIADHHEAGEETDFNIESITCWDVTTLPEDEVTYVLLLLYGYNAGKAGQSTMSGSDIESKLTAVGEFCGDNPDTPAVQAFNNS